MERYVRKATDRNHADASWTLGQKFMRSPACLGPTNSSSRQVSLVNLTQSFVLRLTTKLAVIRKAAVCCSSSDVKRVWVGLLYLSWRG